MNGLEDRRNKGYTACPTVAVIKSLKDSIPNNSFDRFLNDRPLSQAELYAKRSVGHQCRTKLTHDKAKYLWENTVKKFVILEHQGKLPTYQETKALTNNSTMPSKTELYSKGKDLTRNLSKSQQSTIDRINKLREKRRTHQNEV